MIDAQAALCMFSFEIAQTQFVGDVPSHAEQHDIQWKSQSLDNGSRIGQACHQSPDRCLTRQADQQASHH
jgi:hypothetical protein